AAMKRVDPDFTVSEFLQGARGAYEMILMAFEKGDVASIRPFISEDIYDVFSDVIATREAEGLTVEATFIGISEIAVQDVEFNANTKEAEVAIRFTGEYTYTVRDKAGDIVEGGPNSTKRQRDVWTFARAMGSNDPNWVLVSTGE
ncbi:MAG: Tim44 domain-containing protein, partial [Marivivens sp.]|nr:Tim44 domain-containing protein [Marivivens sp.]NDH03008.1 Tim44 domain-containing protein [Marivivens sp.]